MARFRGTTTAMKNAGDVFNSTVSPKGIDANADGWNIGGRAEIRPNFQDDERDQVTLTATAGSKAATMSHVVALIKEQKDALPELRIHTPSVYIATSAFSRVILIDDETDAETVIYTAPAAEGK